MIKIKVSPYFIILGLAAGVTVLLYFLFLNSPYFDQVHEWAQSYFWALFLLIILIKVTGILWPPLPGGVATIGSIPFIGGVWAYLADFTGTVIGSVLAYYIGKRYGKTFLEHFIGLEAAKQAESIRIKEGREIEAIFIMRTLGAGLVVEAVSYGSGLLKIKYEKFLAATILSHLTLGIPAFYLYSQMYNFQNIPYIMFLYAIAIPILWKLRKRYFE